uniref:Uncharacterized protein n=1 Tax=Anguilla anguilla TaxID=7936 RepID=A0A0E9Q2P9_ANGAN
MKGFAGPGTDRETVAVATTSSSRERTLSLWE